MCFCLHMFHLFFVRLSSVDCSCSVLFSSDERGRIIETHINVSIVARCATNVTTKHLLTQMCVACSQIDVVSEAKDGSILCSHFVANEAERMQHRAKKSGSAEHYNRRMIIIDSDAPFDGHSRCTCAQSGVI